MSWLGIVAIIGGFVAVNVFFAVLMMFKFVGGDPREGASREEALDPTGQVLLTMVVLGGGAVAVVAGVTLLLGGLDALIAAGGALALFVFLSVAVLALTYLERKVLGRIQQRLGPMRVGPWGLLQPVADAVKLVVKEDITPSWADRGVYWLAPVAFFIPTFLIWLVIPFAGGWVVRDFDLGLLYIIAFSVLAIAGLFMAGWGSANKYGFLGSLRAIAQLISYEIPVIVVALTVAMMAGSLNLSEIVAAQASVPYLALQPLGFLLFLLGGLAEIGRTPFDIYHAESEVMGGPFVEYSGAHWAIFYLAEYVNTFLVAVLITLLFLSGWVGPALPGVLWFFIKVFAVVTVIFWFRGTFPRLRIDQLMGLGWKVLIPLSFLNFVLTAFAVFYAWPGWAMTAMGLAQLGALVWLVHSRITAPGRRPEVRMIPARELRSPERAGAG